MQSPSFLALLRFFIVTKDLHFQKNQRTSCFLVLISKLPKKGLLSFTLAAAARVPRHCCKTAAHGLGPAGLPGRGTPEALVELTKTRACQGKAQPATASAALSALQGNAKLCTQECFMKNLLRHFEALCYCLLKPYCVNEKTCKYFIAQPERGATGTELRGKAGL